MNLHNTDEVVGHESERKTVRVPHKNADSDAELTIADELDVGGDPYNSTGRHVIMTLKTKRED